jgi:hypothetical protein
MLRLIREFVKFIIYFVIVMIAYNYRSFGPDTFEDNSLGDDLLRALQVLFGTAPKQVTAQLTGTT